MVPTAVSTVAKKRTNRQTGGEGAERTPMALQIRGSTKWKAAVERLAVHEGLSLASLVDRALRKYAREVEFPEEIPKR